MAMRGPVRAAYQRGAFRERYPRTIAQSIGKSILPKYGTERFFLRQTDGHRIAHKYMSDRADLLTFISAVQSMLGDWKNAANRAIRPATARIVACVRAIGIFKSKNSRRSHKGGRPRFENLLITLLSRRMAKLRTKCLLFAKR